MRKWVLFIAFLLCLDLVTKILAEHHLPPLSGGRYPFGGIPIFSLGGVSCSLNYVVNTGAAWGLFADHSTILFALRIGMILALLLFAHKSWPIVLILSGAIGNVIDSFLYGYVIDFIHFTFWNYHFPVFNVADSCITIGIVWLMWSQRNCQQRCSL